MMVNRGDVEGREFTEVYCDLCGLWLDVRDSATPPFQFLIRHQATTCVANAYATGA